MLTNKIIEQHKLIKLLYKTINKNKYPTAIQFINDFSKMGASHNSCMILEMILMNKSYKDIKNILLFIDEVFNKHILEIHTILKEFKHRKKIISLRHN